MKKKGAKKSPQVSKIVPEAGPLAEMTSSKTDKSSEGLANRALLDKMDKLRELGISDMVPLPQVYLPQRFKQSP